MLPDGMLGSNLIVMMDRVLDELLARDDMRVIARLAVSIGVDVSLVGGGLRDCLLERDVHDLDFVLTGAYGELPRMFAAEAGATFFWLDEKRLQARVAKKEDGRIQIYDFAPQRGASLADDLLQRDFTINALALSVTGRVRGLFDPLHGRSDLRKGVIRLCSASTFDDDPLRLLRAIRFAAELDFALDEDTGEILRQKANLLGVVASERIRDELFRILAASRAGDSLRKLSLTGLWRAVFPEESLREKELERDFLADVELRASRVDGLDNIVEWLESVLPEGKQRLSGYLNREVEAGISVWSLIRLAVFLGTFEEMASAKVAERLRLGRNAGRMLQFLGKDERALFAILEHTASERAMYRFFRDREPAGLAQGMLALAAGAISEQCCYQLAAYYFSRYEVQGSDLFLTGDEIMAQLGVGPGKVLGEVMARLREGESTGVVGTKEKAREFIKNLLTRETSMR